MLLIIHEWKLIVITDYTALDSTMKAIASAVRDGGGTNTLQRICAPSRIEETRTHTMVQLATSSTC
jgi:hypothetical protein